MRILYTITTASLHTTSHARLAQSFSTIQAVPCERGVPVPSDATPISRLRPTTTLWAGSVQSPTQIHALPARANQTLYGVGVAVLGVVRDALIPLLW